MREWKPQTLDLEAGVLGIVGRVKGMEEIQRLTLRWTLCLWKAMNTFATWI